LQRKSQAGLCTVIVLPAGKVPARIALAIGVSSSRWMARFSGRAPYTGS
jgi:hypothetical protein